MPDLQSPDEDWSEDELDLDEMSGSFEDVDTNEDEILLEDFVAQLEMEGDDNEGEDLPKTVPAHLITPTNTAFTTTFTSAMLTKDGHGSQIVDVDLYDSGASCHMSGYRHRFLNFTSINPRPITAANKRKFDAISMGDMYVNVPNGDSKSRVLLKDVLYAPSMGVTLVSISCIAAAGSTVIFSGGSCHIFHDSKRVLGRIEANQGLYRMYTARAETAGYAGRVKELLTIDELHRCLGHVAHYVAQMLVKKGLITGVELEPNSMASSCKSCEWGKGQRKPIQKVWVEERATAVGEEVHSDIWGPATVEMINRK